MHELIWPKFKIFWGSTVSYTMLYGIVSIIIQNISYTCALLTEDASKIRDNSLTLTVQLSQIRDKFTGWLSRIHDKQKIK